MANPSARRVKILREITYNPPGTLAWYRVFRAGWEGPVTEQQYKFLLAEQAGEPVITPRELDDPGANTGAGSEGAAP